MRTRARGYGLVLLLVVASIAMQMMVEGSNATRFLTVALQAATLVAAVQVSGEHRAALRVAALAAMAAVAAALLTWIINGEIPPAASATVNGLLVAFAPAAIARGLIGELRERREVTVATLAGVLAIYLLAGMFFSFLYGVIGAADAGALFAGQDTADAGDALYFSFATLCTVGYGDLTPAGDLARTVAVVEMLAGQIYLVTVVALIVGNLGRPTAAARPARR
ncbi:MAG: hypothetical protein QOH58_465 [Thermoleophilaceae bacterium]|jgi:hypothetical protein|nr:hypothetical protein [Thermoleophilaceae bacterium]